jgi:hypothetical protein
LRGLLGQGAAVSGRAQGRGTLAARLSHAADPRPGTALAYALTGASRSGPDTPGDPPGARRDNRQL